jgi:hypothetical protein
LILLWVRCSLRPSTLANNIKLARGLTDMDAISDVRNRVVPIYMPLAHGV